MKLPVGKLAAYPRDVDWGVVLAWALGVALVVYLGLEGGGFDPLVSDPVGIAVWWILLAAALVGVVPRRRLGSLAWCALGLLAAFAAWSALSLSWTESVERTSADAARVLTYLGIFALALFVPRQRAARRIVAGVGVGVAAVAIVALLSRLQPTWFPGTNQASMGLLSGAPERLSYPLNYWNGLAALIAIGLPAVLQIATSARAAAARGLAAAALPAMALTVFFTLSRTGMAAAAVALVVFLGFSSNRLPKLLTVCTAGIGGAALILLAASRHSLQHGLADSTARHQGDVMLMITLLVCAAVGLAQVGFSVVQARYERPRWTVVSKRQSTVFLLAVVLAAVIAAAAFNAPGRASNAWTDFKQNEAGSVTGVGRLGSLNGESRYQFWSAAVAENRSKPLTGTGSGTFRFWWARHADTRDVVNDTHSLYLQTLGELGIVGAAVLVAFLMAILVGGGRAAVRARRRQQDRLAAALAGCVAFCLTATFDWTWLIPVVPVAFLLLASTLVTARDPTLERQNVTPVPLRIGVALVAISALVAIGIPLSSTSLVRQSQADVEAGDMSAALSAARSAQNAQPSAATPRLQQALLLEEAGELPLAAGAAHAATERELTNWRTWLVLARIEGERGRAVAAVRAYRRARSLNPLSPLFAR